MKRPSLLALFALFALPHVGDALPLHGSCVPQFSAPPFLSGPPTWASWAGASAIDTSLDDPRWATSTAISFQASSGADSASATAPLNARAVWDPANKYLYMSFISDLSPDNTTIPRDVFVAFRRTTPETIGGAPANGMLFQFHIGGGGPALAAKLPHCAKFDGSGGCNAPGSGNPTSWWRVFLDTDSSGQCGTGGPFGHAWVPWVSPTGAPFTWMDDGSVAMWQYGNTPDVPPLVQNRWAVQVRFKIAPAASVNSITDGIQGGSTYWFEATENDTKGIWTSVAHWPTNLTTSVCPVQSTPNQVIHQELGPKNLTNCPLCSLDFYSFLTTFVGSPPAGSTCDAGLKIDSAHIGNVVDTAGPYDTIGLTHTIKALNAAGTAPAVNTMIAQVASTGGSIGPVPLRARFRVADWGTTWGANAAWKDIPGQSTATTSLTVTPTSTKALTYNWTLGNDPKLGKSEICSYLQSSPGCADCTCGGTNPIVDNCIAGDTGTRAPGGPCLAKHASHQCMLVEVQAPNGNAVFTQSSAFSNWDFGEMSTFTRDAIIDARGVPAAADGSQKVLLVVVPRNMPRTLPPVSGTGYIADRLMAAVHHVTRLDVVRKLSDAEVTTRATKLGRTLPQATAIHASRHATILGEPAVTEVERARTLLAPRDFELSAKLLDIAADAREIDNRPIAPHTTPAADLTHRVVEALGPEVAAKVVPTIEIYPYFQPANHTPVWQPMPAFSVFLSHEGGLSGFTGWSLSGPGVVQVKHGVYMLTIPKAQAKSPAKVRVTTTLSDAHLPPHGPPHGPLHGPPHGPHGGDDDPQPHNPHPQPGPHPVTP